MGRLSQRVLGERNDIPIKNILFFPFYMPYNYIHYRQRLYTRKLAKINRQIQAIFDLMFCPELIINRKVILENVIIFHKCLNIVLHFRLGSYS